MQQENEDHIEMPIQN